MLQVVTTINYNSVRHLQLLHANRFSLSVIVFITHSLDHTLQIKLSIRTISLHTTNFLSLETLKQSQIHRRMLLRKFTPRTASKNCLGRSRSQSHIATDGQSVNKSWCRAVWHLRSCFCGAPSLTRRRVCLLYMLLALASGVFLGSESLGTRDHILPSQTRDFPFRRLLRLAGSRWRYSTPPPHGLCLGRPRCLQDYSSSPYSIALFAVTCLLSRCLGMGSVTPLFYCCVT
jgi:hypothetical protein